jgi:hypothetical protein
MRTWDGLGKGTMRVTTLGIMLTGTLETPSNLNSRLTQVLGRFADADMGIRYTDLGPGSRRSEPTNVVEFVDEDIAADGPQELQTPQGR